MVAMNDHPGEDRGEKHEEEDQHGDDGCRPKNVARAAELPNLR